jgi:hypothetical protein
LRKFAKDIGLDGANEGKGTVWGTEGAVHASVVAAGHGRKVGMGLADDCDGTCLKRISVKLRPLEGLFDP